MTRKDFELIASTINKVREASNKRAELIAIRALAFALAAELYGANPRFNTERFITACGFGL